MSRYNQTTFALALWALVLLILAFLVSDGYQVFAAVMAGILGGWASYRHAQRP
jgi:hypothetical protein